MLCNESFSITNEIEGAEVARQVLEAMLESGTKVFYVTHLYTLAERLRRQGREDALFLRAERGEDGRRTFRIVEGEPLPTSFGVDIFELLGGWEKVAAARGMGAGEEQEMRG